MQRKRCRGNLLNVPAVRKKLSVSCAEAMRHSDFAILLTGAQEAPDNVGWFFLGQRPVPAGAFFFLLQTRFWTKNAFFLVLLKF